MPPKPHFARVFLSCAALQWSCLFVNTVMQRDAQKLYRKTKVKACTGPGCYESTCEDHNTKPVGLCPRCVGEMLSVKDTRPPPPNGPCSVFPSRGGLSCVCADTGIFTLAKQGSCIDLCDCDEFGIVIWIYWLMWPSDYGPASLLAPPFPPKPHSQPMRTEDNGDFKCNK